MNDREKANIWQRYQPMISRLAREFDPSHGHVYQDVYEAGVDWLAVAVTVWDTEYDSSKSSETTWVYRNLRWRMLDCIRRMGRTATRTSALNPDIPTHTSWRQHLSTLLTQATEEAALVVDLVLSGPSELLTELMHAVRGRGDKRKRGQQVLYRYLSEGGWTSDKIQRAFQEAEATMDSLWG